MRSLPLAAVARSPMLARRFVIDVLTENDALQVAADATLLVTELVTNAVMHAGTGTVVTVAVDDVAVVITVADQGSGPLLARPVTELAEGGRGLWMVHEISSTWGTQHDAGGTSVWFRLERTATPPPAASTLPVATEPATPLAAPDVSNTAAWSAVEWLLGTDADLSSAAALSEQLARAVDAARADVAVLVAPGAIDGDEVRVLGLPAEAAATLQVRFSDAQLEKALQAHGISGFLHAPLPGGAGSLHLGWCEPKESATAPVLAELAAGRLALLLRLQRLEEADSRRHGFTAMLAEASDLLGGSLDPELTAALVPSLVVPRLARWAAVHLAGDDGRLFLSAVSHVDEDEVPTLREQLATSGALAAGSPGVSGLGQVVVIPLTARRRQLGQLTLGLDPSSALRPDAYTVVEDLARRAGLALDNARVHREQADVAMALQAALLPPELPRDEAIEFGAQYVAAGEGSVVGGDFYDVIPLPDGSYGLIVGDVQGKGPIAAAVTGLAREIVRLLLGQGQPLPEVLRQLNSVLLKREPARFCTAVLARVTADQLSLCLAGHPSPVLVRAGQQPRLIGEPGSLLGVMEDVDVEEVVLPLTSGDALVLYTDGLTERRAGPEMLGDRGVLDLVATCRSHSAASMAQTLLRGAIDYTAAPLRDDLAVLVVRVR